ncbi:MAG: NAD kinase [Bacteroidetes bacterium]|nr:MAG: NAD kinase [Bacteroidota bacterium]
MKVAIYSRGLDAAQQEHLRALLQALKLHKAEVQLFHTMAGPAQKSLLRSFNVEPFAEAAQLHPQTDCLITLGGDGTVLDSAIMVGSKGIPILGINFGRLGFLASIGKEEMAKAVEALASQTFITDQRTLIHADASVPIFAEAPFGLNEFVLHKKDVSSMISIHTYLNGEFLNTYWADGLIVSTPTGSTAYNLSCGGPIVFPDSGSLVITPIAPHNLNVRPIVVPDTNVISFEVEGRTNEVICSLDNRKQVIHKDVQIAVRKETFTTGLVRLNENTFLETLRNKLAWGLDKRN